MINKEVYNDPENHDIIKSIIALAKKNAELDEISTQLEKAGEIFENY